MVKGDYFYPFRVAALFPSDDATDPIAAPHPDFDMARFQEMNSKATTEMKWFYVRQIKCWKRALLTWLAPFREGMSTRSTREEFY